MPLKNDRPIQRIGKIVYNRIFRDHWEGLFTTKDNGVKKEWRFTGNPKSDVIAKVNKALHELGLKQK